VNAGNFLKSFEVSPPSQQPVSFNLDEVMEKLSTAAGSR